MDELIAQITEKTGVTVEKAKEMVGVTTEWMKNKLPEDLAGQVTSVLSEAGGWASTAASKATEVAEGAAGTAAGAAGGLWDKTKDTVSGFTAKDGE